MPKQGEGKAIQLLFNNINTFAAFRSDSAPDSVNNLSSPDFQVYEKKQERTMERISRITSNKRLRRLERMITKNPLDEDDSDSKSSQRFVRKRRRKVGFNKAWIRR